MWNDVSRDFVNPMGWESGGPQIRFGGAKVVLYFEVCNFLGDFDENFCEKCCEFYCGMGIGVDVFRKFVGIMSGMRT